MTSSEERKSEQTGRAAEYDQGALLALLREVQATRFVVWTPNSAGGLQSTPMPTSDIAQNVNMAIRMININFEEAIKLSQTATKQFDSAVHRWESQTRQSEAKLRAETAARRLNEVMAKHNAIKTRINPVKSLFRRANQSLADYDMMVRQRARDEARDDEAADADAD